MNEPGGTSAGLVWGRQTRLFHWVLVVVFSVSLATGLLADIDIMTWHLYSGYTLLGLLIFRMLSGLVGRDYSRFGRFPLSPRAVPRYLRGAETFPGHNPLGAWMIVFMLAALLTQVLSGMLTTDDFFTEGPWVYLAEDEWTGLAGSIHRSLYWVLIGMVVLHLCAIAFYRWRKGEDLLTPMISGRRQMSGEQVAAENMPVLQLLILALLSAGAAYLLVTW